MKNISIIGGGGGQHDNIDDDSDSDELHDRADDLFDQLDDYQDGTDKTDVGSIRRSGDDPDRVYNVPKAYLSLFIYSMVLISFSWARSLLSEAYGYEG
jgi:hypothetical protein